MLCLLHGFSILFFMHLLHIRSFSPSSSSGIALSKPLAIYPRGLPPLIRGFGSCPTDFGFLAPFSVSLLRFLFSSYHLLHSLLEDRPTRFALAQAETHLLCLLPPTSRCTHVLLPWFDSSSLTHLFTPDSLSLLLVRFARRLCAVLSTFSLTLPPVTPSHSPYSTATIHCICPHQRRACPLSHIIA
jgi:hypothetical protein